MSGKSDSAGLSRKTPPLLWKCPRRSEDEAGRKLSNARSFPLKLRTDEYPPLAKFAADFGILELKADAALPVTLRNIEPEIAARSFQVEGGEENFDPLPPRPAKEDLDANLKGKVLKVPADKADQMLAWIRKASDRRWEDRDKSIFGPVTQPKTKSFTLPKLHGSKPFEVLAYRSRNRDFMWWKLKAKSWALPCLESPSRCLFRRPSWSRTYPSISSGGRNLLWSGLRRSTKHAGEAGGSAGMGLRRKNALARDHDGNGIARMERLPREGSARLLLQRIRQRIDRHGAIGLTTCLSCTAAGTTE